MSKRKPKMTERERVECADSILFGLEAGLLEPRVAFAALHYLSGRIPFMATVEIWDRFSKLQPKFIVGGSNHGEQALLTLPGSNQ